MSDNQSFVDLITDKTLTRMGNEYFQSIRTYSWGDSDTSYFRVEKDGSVYYLDTKSNKESIDVPNNPSLNFKWNSSDNEWQYQVVEVNATLKTPKNTFADCLVIKAEQLNNSDTTKLSTYFNYYSKSIGYVGSKVDDQLMSYLQDWDIK